MSRRWLWAAVAVLAYTSGIPREASATPLPPIRDAQDQQFLTRLARRTLDQYVADGSIYQSVYSPPSLASLTCPVVVNLRRHGKLLGAGAAGPGALVPGTIEATIAALRTTAADGHPPPDVVRDVLIEIEVIGAEESVPVGESWLQPGAVGRFFEPGIDGISLVSPTALRRLCPSEIISKNMAVDDALRSMVEGMGGVTDELTVRRFRTTHWYQGAAEAPVVPLVRGQTLVRPGDVTPAAVEQALERMVQCLVYRQQPSGFFGYEYEPAANGYSRRDDAVHQAGATWALSAYAARKLDRNALRAAQRGLEAHRSWIRVFSPDGDLACVTSPDERNKLGLTAQICLAMSAYPNADRFQEDRARLVNGVLWLQLASGEWVTAFPPARRLDGFDVFPGVTMLALAEEYRADPQERLLTALTRGIEHYHPSPKENPSASAAVWLLRAVSRAAVVTRREDWARQAFVLADGLAERQLRPGECEWLELHGGVSAPPGTMPDVLTAVCLQGWLDAAELADRLGDAERRTRYLEAANAAVRFVLQLQWRDVDAYFAHQVPDAAGAVRTSPVDNRLRIENLQYAISALADYRASRLTREP